MAVHSTVPPVRSALVTNLAARSGLAGVQVTRSFPDDLLRYEGVYLGVVHGTAHIPVFRGPARMSRQESYSVDVHFAAAETGDDAQAAEDKCFSMYAELEDMLANDATIGGLVQSAVPDAYELTSGQDAARQGWTSQLRVAVAIEARLT